eukprot:15092684-Alexandrium_andersonii.AAC.1
MLSGVQLSGAEYRARIADLSREWNEHKSMASNMYVDCCAEAVALSSDRVRVACTPLRAKK